jgi:Protein of unknown function (DUF1236)
MKMNWLGTAALSFAIGIGANTGAVLAQQHSDSPQKPEQGARSERQSPQSKEMPSTRDERRGGGQSDRTAQDSGREQRRSEGTSRREQAQEQQSREQQQRQSQDERKSRDERRGREAQQATDQQKRQSVREDQQKQDRAAESAKSSEQKQRQSEQQSQRGERSTGSTQQSQYERKNSQRAGETKQPSGREQAAQPSQQNTTAADRGETQRRETVGQGQDRASGRASMVNDEQRTKVVERLGRERDSWRDTQSLNIRVRVGERLPDRVRPRPLPSDIVRIAPEYRGYDYTMIEDEIAIVDPRSRDIVDVIDERGGRSAGGMRSAEGYTGDRVHYSFSRDEREMLKRAAENSMTVGSTSGGGSGQTCVTMRPIPEELARSRPELASYRYVAIGDQMVLVDPREQKIVEVID